MIKVDVSIIITCFKKEKYLEELINSILQNTVQPKEIILVHDGCEEGMAYRGCTTIILDENLGVAKARDVGVTNSTGHFLLFLDGDDKIAPDYIEKAIKVDTDIAYCDILGWHDHEHSASGRHNYIWVVPRRLTLDQMWGHCRIVVSSLMTRKVYDELGGFRTMDKFEDWDFWLRAMAKGFNFKKFDSLFYYRQTSGTRNQCTKEEQRKAFNKVKSGFIYKKGGNGEKSTIKEINFNGKTK